jgi:hypothetical protein
MWISPAKSVETWGINRLTIKNVGRLHQKKCRPKGMGDFTHVRMECGKAMGISWNVELQIKKS